MNSEIFPRTTASRMPLTVPFSGGEFNFTVIDTVNNANFDELTKIAACTVHDQVFSQLNLLLHAAGQPSRRVGYLTAIHHIRVSGQEVRLLADVTLQAHEVNEQRGNRLLKGFLENIATQAQLNDDPVPNHNSLDEFNTLPVTDPVFIDPLVERQPMMSGYVDRYSDDWGKQPLPPPFPSNYVPQIVVSPPAEAYPLQGPTID